MKTSVKVILAFIAGVISTIGVLYIIAIASDTEENRLKEEIRLETLKNIKSSLENNHVSDVMKEQTFELKTTKGMIELRTNMHKDEVKQLMGLPDAVDMMNMLDETHEKWEYKGSNEYGNEFVFRFINGKLNSVHQYKDK